MATVHIIGAGISGLAAASQLAARHVPVKLYEATAAAGGRCRSAPHKGLGSIDSGLHLIAGGDSETFRYLDRIDARDRVIRVKPASFPAASVADYAALARAACFPGEKPLAHFITEENTLYDAWATHFSRLHLHTSPDSVSAQAASHALRNHRHGLYMAARTLADSFLEPALTFLDYCGGSAYFSHALTGFARTSERITALNFTRKKVAITQNDVIILATPPAFTRSLFPDISIPESNHAAITLHIAAEHRETPCTLRFIHDGKMDLIRYEEGVIRVAMRVADGAWHVDQPLLAERTWRQLQAIHPHLRGQKLGVWALWREKRAGHLLDIETVCRPKTPLQPHPQCILAGDWLDTSRPANIESAAASGHRAAALAQALVGKRPLHHQ